MDKHYQVIIIGAGPAGLSAAIYSSRAGKSTLILERIAIGGQMGPVADISNYPGYSKIDGITLASNMAAQAEELGAVIEYDGVAKIAIGKPHKISTMSGTVLTADNIIIATGVRAKRLGVDGEEKLVGSGISYCAECDGNFFKGKAVVVAGSGKKAIQEALYLSKLCSSVTIISRTAIPESHLSKLSGISNIRIAIDEIIGLEGIPLTALILKSGTKLSASGLFVALGVTSETGLLHGIGLSLDNLGFVITDDSMRTNIDGVYAAGDIRSGSVRQIVTACADGATAAMK